MRGVQTVSVLSLSNNISCDRSITIPAQVGNLKQLPIIIMPTANLLNDNRLVLNIN